MTSPTPPAAGGWLFETCQGSVRELHGLEPRAPYRRTVFHMQPEESGLVLGSTQPVSIVRPDTDVVVRRSGGGAVLVEPGGSVWIDVFIPRGDPLWDDDVNRSFAWVGAAWVRALAVVGIEGEVHAGALERTPWSKLVCFAGIGPGEVVAAGRKVVGLSQRRTRHGARFQCMAYTRLPAISTIVDLLDLADGEDREALRTHLDASTGIVAASPETLVAAFLDALP
jgi:hypothetical protein